MFIRFFAIFILFQACIFGSIQNGRFEIPDPNQMTQYMTPPMNWQIENYAALLEFLIPNPENGPTVTWKIEHPAEGQTFCLLSTGDLYGPGSDQLITRSSISQSVSFASGDILMGSYFFGTCDYFPYNDTGSIVLFPVDPNDGLRDILLATANVEDVGNFGSTEDWVNFSYTFNEATQGQYLLTCEVIDVRDTKYKSYLAVDNLRVCFGTPLYGDINLDCAVDLTDFDFFAHLWMADCSDPNTYDPNLPCTIADFNPDELIDPNDLLLFTDCWLENYKAE